MIFRLKPGVFALPCFFGSKKAGRSKKSGAVELLVFAARHSQFVLQHRLKTLVPLGLIGKGKMWYQRRIIPRDVTQVRNHGDRKSPNLGGTPLKWPKWLGL